VSGKRGPKSSSERVERLLKMLPWLVANGPSVSIAEMASQFGMSEEELLAEIELASTCGLPPYTPDMLAGIWIEEGTINVFGSLQFDRRLQLTREEAFGLSLLGAAAGKLRGFRRSAALRSALRKLRKVLGDDAIAVDLESPQFLDAVSEAARTGRKIAIQYASMAREDVSGRTIVVRHVYSDRGHWYVNAEDGKNDWSMRTFRVDRIREVTPTEEFVEVRSAAVEVPSWFSSSAEGTEVSLTLPAGAAWVVESYPTRTVAENADGSVDVTLIASSEHWLGRLLLRAGTGARVRNPGDWTDLQARTAAAVLARYSDDNAGN
jgi:proteasome accessory factor C